MGTGINLEEKQVFDVISMIKLWNDNPTKTQDIGDRFGKTTMPLSVAFYYFRVLNICNCVYYDKKVPKKNPNKLKKLRS